MPKNLILIHLESVSNTILWQYRVELRTVWEMMKSSLVYNHFYSTATSTVMARKHLFGGSSRQNDGVSVFGQHRMPEHPSWGWQHTNHLWYDLFFSGYGKNGRIYTVAEFHDTPAVYRHKSLTVFPDVGDTLPVVRAALTQAKNDGIPFYFYLNTMVSHITGEDKAKRTARSFTDRFRIGYIRLNDMIQNLLNTLIDLKLLDNSVLVFYGDHGDELWSHGLLGGWCHTNTPYASQCWTPMFIYEKGGPVGSTDQLASTIDLKETLVKRLVPDFDPAKIQLNPAWSRADGELPYAIEFPEYPLRPRSGPLAPFKEDEFSGIDLNHETRDLAFSQNLFALQLQFNDQSKVLAKGYAVTDGTYRVTVTAGGEDPRDGGLEFFCDMVDPTNGRNLLDFFKLDANGEIGEFSPPAEANSREFFLAFNPEAVAHLKTTFNRLRAALYEYIRRKEAQALPESTPPIHTMPESVFNHALKRPYKDQPASEFVWKQ